MEIRETVYWTSNKRGRYRYLTTRGPVVTDAILTKLDQSRLAQSTKDKTKQVLSQGWEETRGLFHQGGVLTSKGLIVALGLNDPTIPKDLVETLTGDEFDVYTASYVSKRFHLDLDTKKV